MSKRARHRAAAIAAKHIALVPLPDDDTDTDGPAGTYGCACVSRDPRSCLIARSDSLPSLGEQCECQCHGWSEHDD